MFVLCAGIKIVCLGAVFLFFLIDFICYVVREAKGLWGKEFWSGKWLGLWVRKLELEGPRRAFQVGSVASQVNCWRNGGPLSRWKTEPHQLRHLIGTLTMTMMEVCAGSPYNLLYLYFRFGSPLFFGFSVCILFASEHNKALGNSMLEARV